MLRKKSAKNDLHVAYFGIAFGLTGGFYTFFIGIVSWLTGWGDMMAALLSEWYIGFSPTLMGAVIGMVWGFVDWFIGGVIIALLYNTLKNLK